MANTILTPTMLTRELLMRLENNLVFSKWINREYDDRFAVAGAKIGSVLNIRKPPRYLGTSGPALAVEDQIETTVPLAITTQFHVDVQFSSVELTLSLDDFGERVLQPAAAAVANKIDFDGLAQVSQVFNQSGTPGTPPSTPASVLAVGRVLNEMGAPIDQQRSMVVNPAANASVVGGLTNLFNNPTKISDQYDTGNMGMALGFRWGMDQNVQSFTNGTQPAATGTVNGAGQTGSTILVNSGTITGTIKAGSVISFAGVNAVNPQNRVNTSSAAMFVVTADVAAAATSIPISPAIVLTGSSQNVTASPANAAVITIQGAASQTYAVNVGFHRDAFCLGMADLVMPGGVDFAARETYKGMRMRIVRQYVISTDQFPCRVEVLYGVKTIYPELACRFAG